MAGKTAGVLKLFSLAVGVGAPAASLFIGIASAEVAESGQAQRVIPRWDPSMKWIRCATCGVSASWVALSELIALARF